jgi:hypothetical protein
VYDLKTEKVAKAQQKGCRIIIIIIIIIVQQIISCNVEKNKCVTLPTAYRKCETSAV